LWISIVTLSADSGQPALHKHARAPALAILGVRTIVHTAFAGGAIQDEQRASSPSGETASLTDQDESTRQHITGVSLPALQKCFSAAVREEKTVYG
jgi:hypothetical protein